MFRNFIKALAGDPNKRDVQKYTKIVEAINSLEPRFSRLTDPELREQTDAFRARLAAALEGQTDPKERRAAEQAALDELLPEAFAAVREAAILSEPGPRGRWPSDHHFVWARLAWR